MSLATPERDDVAMLLGFTRAVRAAGVAVTPDRAQSFLDATSRVGATARRNVYWAGRATLCSGPGDFEPYDLVFERWFAAEPPTSRPRRPAASTVVRADLSADVETDGESGDEESIAVLASTQETLRHRDVATLAASERAELAALFAALRPVAPRRRGNRRHPRHTGDVDPARTIRDQLRRGGEPGPLRYRRREPRPRRVVFLVDVSGSMSAYADSLLRLAHRMVVAEPRTEVFTLGTRLTRVTSALRVPDAEQALVAAGEAVPDWSGGTRLGEVIRAFIDRWGQRGMARGAVVVILSDGWERGDPVLLGEQVRRLSRLAYRVIWANPHRGKAGYAPVQGGIAATLPYLDGLVAGHSFAAFEELLEMVADA